jgi:hypothetical protein
MGLERSNRLFLDVGGDLRVGVLDHHHFRVFEASAARMVERFPDYVRGAVDTDGSEPLTIVVHENPDLDSVVAAALALEVLEGEPDDAVRRLAAYVDRVDSGRLGTCFGNPFSLYSAYAQILHDLTEQYASSGEDDGARKWSEVMEAGIDLVRSVLGRARDQNLAIESIDAFACEKSLNRKRDREFALRDRERYESKMTSPDTRVRKVRVRLPLPIGGLQDLNGLLVRNVQGGNVQDRVLYFKDWARTDSSRNPESGGFPLLCVFEERAKGEKGRCWISLRPDDGPLLTGLGRMLEEAEVRARMERLGEDSRWIDPKTNQTRDPRPGFENPDPWYDGRGHDHRIIETPADGTVLSADEIEAILLEYGRGIEAGCLLERLPGPESLLPEIPVGARERRVWDELAREQVRTLDLVYKASQEQKAETDTSPVRHRDIFISYSRTRKAWIEQNLLPQLYEAFGAERVFMDLRNLNAGCGWLRELGEAIECGRVFIPVLSEEYDRSPWCQWESEMARMGQISCGCPVIVPLLLEPANLPVILKSLHGEAVWHDGWQDRLLGRVRSSLAGTGSLVALAVKDE